MGLTLRRDDLCARSFGASTAGSTGSTPEWQRGCVATPSAGLTVVGSVRVTAPIPGVQPSWIERGPVVSLSYLNFPRSCA